MPQEPFTRMTDILFGHDTDIHFEDEDLMTTTGIDYIEREIYKLLITEIGDWKADPTLGVSLNRYTGEHNTREVAKEMEKHISQGLRLTAAPGQVHVRVIPTGEDSVMIFVRIFSAEVEVVKIPFEFSYVDGIRKLDVADPRVTEQQTTADAGLNDIDNLRRPNRYWTRISRNFTER